MPKHITDTGNQIFADNVEVLGNINANGNMFLNGEQVATVVDPVRTTLTGNGSSSVFAIGGASGLVNPSSLIVAIDGALQEPVADYTVASGNITFTSPLANGAKAVVIAPTNVLQTAQTIPADGSVTSSKLDTNLSLSGQLTLTGQAATSANSAMTRVLADKNIMFNVAKVRILPTANMNYNTIGAGTSASNGLDGLGLTGSLTASAFTRAVLTRVWTTFSGSTGANNLCSVPVAFAFFGMFNLQATNTVIRFIVGDAGSGAPALPSANAISGRGFGFEIFFDSVPKIRLFAHDGTTYTTSAAVNSGTSFNQSTSLLIASDGAGNLKLFIANSGSIVQRIPESATITHTGAPTSSTYAAAFASILTANNTTAPLSQQALVRIPQVIIHSNQVY